MVAEAVSPEAAEAFLEAAEAWAEVPEATLVAAEVWAAALAEEAAAVPGPGAEDPLAALPSAVEAAVFDRQAEAVIRRRAEADTTGAGDLARA